MNDLSKGKKDLDSTVEDQNVLPEIKERDGKPTVNARNLHKALESKYQFADWIKNRIEKYEFQINQDYISISEISEKPQGGRPSTEYYLSISMAKELCMVENNEQGRKIRLYFIECERQAKLGKNSEPLSDDLLIIRGMEAAHRKLKQIEEKLKAEQDHVKLLIHDNKSYTTTEIAKELNLKSAQALNELLEKNGIQYKVNRTWVLHASFSGNDYEVIKQEELDNGIIIYNRHWTGRGRDFILNFFQHKEGE